MPDGLNVPGSGPVSLVSPNFMAEIVRRVVAQMQATGPGMAVGRLGAAIRQQRTQQGWWGVITAAGPASEADYSDARYWVESAVEVTALGDWTPTLAADVEASSASAGTESVQWVTATNLAEIISASHTLLPGTVVWVQRIYGINADSPFYVFNILPQSPVMLYLISVQADYLTCNTESDGSGDTYYVAKPTRLRSTDTAARAVANQTYTLTKSAFTTGVTSGDAQSCTGTRSSDSATETLGVDEPYIAGDEICAVPYPTGLTDPGSNPIVLLDANVDGRHWTAKNSS